MMLTLVVRGLLVVAALIAGWFIEKSSPDFGFLQMALALILVVLAILIALYLPSLFRRRP